MDAGYSSPNNARVRVQRLSTRDSTLEPAARGDDADAEIHVIQLSAGPGAGLG